MVPALRFIGLLNAAIWLGGMFFFTVVGGPTFFTEEVKSLLTVPRAGAAAQIMVERYMILQQWCAAIALVHLVVEWLYTGRLFPKVLLMILVGCLAISLAGSRLLAPRMKQLHLVKYAVQTTPAQKEDAARRFRILHGTSQITNLLALAGVLFYYWRLSSGSQGGRPGAGTRFRP